ncbi:hypothetical protein [uncultured Parolsenella sp.]|uniref:hypothetical protein n=1 Tax=uncultured Parolsenella sp. TaxID=2083008 RepID=UPI0027D9342B|nr:hypothetical protein [uncultured Parolsenella sp.]
MIKRCEWCGRAFECRTSKAKYCGDRCRKAHQRAYRCGVRLMPPSGPVEPSRATIDDGAIASAVAQLHGLAALFDSATERGPKERVPLCAYLRDSISEALLRVGL